MPKAPKESAEGSEGIPLGHGFATFGKGTASPQIALNRRSPITVTREACFLLYSSC